jgi:hypothetical protein
VSMETDLREALRRESPEDLVPLGMLLELLSDVEFRQEDERLGMALTVESLRFDFPFEVEVRADEHGRVRLGAAPPTQEVETSIMPVFHRLVIRVALDGAD